MQPGGNEMGLVKMVAVLAAGTALAWPSAPSASDAAYPLKIEVGGEVAVCQTGTVLCPATVVCDDPSVVTVTGDQRGPVLKGGKPGATLCSAGSASGAGMRRVYQVTVVPKPPPPPG